MRKTMVTRVLVRIYIGSYPSKYASRVLEVLREFVPMTGDYICVQVGDEIWSRKVKWRRINLMDPDAPPRLYIDAYVSDEYSFNSKACTIAMDAVKNDPEWEKDE